MFGKQKAQLVQFFKKIDAVREYCFDLRKERKWLMETNRKLAGDKEALILEIEQLSLKKAELLGEDTRTREERAK